MSLALPHRRWNPLLKEWVLVSPHRTSRPWSGAIETSSALTTPHYDPTCYLCPRNKRVGGQMNDDYKGVYVFSNDFPSLLDRSIGESRTDLHGAIRAEPVTGECRVVCFSPRHDLTLPQLSVQQVVQVIDTWSEEYERLRSTAIRHVMTFENKGAMMGCSNPHPHCQIWSTSEVPNLPSRAIAAQQEYFSAHSTALLQDVATWEEKERDRVVVQNEHWLAVVPYWAIWPFETMVIPRRRLATISAMCAEVRSSWAAVISELTRRYDALFNCSFPYSMGVYQAPFGMDSSALSLYQVFFPPLLRSATVRKFMVGYELCAEAQRDITPEAAAAQLRDTSIAV